MSNPHINKALDFYRLLDGGGYSPDARCKPFWHRENFSHFLQGDDFLVRPVTVEYWPSLLCNCRCSLCPYRLNGARRAADAASQEASNADFFANVDAAQHLAVECRNLGVRSILMTGGGEPFMNPDVAQIARAFVDQGLPIGVYSNGTVASSEGAIQAVAELRPRFVRLSVNAGSADEHRAEYKLTGGWATLNHNARRWARTLAGGIPLSFSWVVTGKEQATTYRGAAEFLRELHRDTQRPIAGHFRPKYVYYDKDGSARCPEHLDHLDFTVICQNVDKFVRPLLRDECAVDVQVNTYAIEISEAFPVPHASFATGWVTSFTHTGAGYITSELNGSTWPNTCWGTLERARDGSWPPLDKLWFGEERQRLWKLYAEEPRLPVYHKLTGVSNVLTAFRSLFPARFTKAETDAFWKSFDSVGFARPAMWDFI